MHNNSLLKYGTVYSVEGDDVSEMYTASIITAIALMMEAVCNSET
jgi:hypothetical protein